MFPQQKKIELFARKNYVGWDNWGLEIPNSKVKIMSQQEHEIPNKEQEHTQMTLDIKY